jgi:hypothetical protein
MRLEPSGVTDQPKKTTWVDLALQPALHKSVEVFPGSTTTLAGTGLGGLSTFTKIEYKPNGPQKSRKIPVSRSNRFDVNYELLLIVKFFD